MSSFFFRCLFLIIWCHYVAVLLPANRCTADHGFEYRYICPFRGTLECAIILDKLIQIFESNTQICLKNQISQRPVITIRRSRISQIISDVLSEVRRTDPWSSFGWDIKTEVLTKFCNFRRWSRPHTRWNWTCVNASGCWNHICKFYSSQNVKNNKHARRGYMSL